MLTASDSVDTVLALLSMSTSFIFIGIVIPPPQFYIFFSIK